MDMIRWITCSARKSGRRLRIKAATPRRTGPPSRSLSRRHTPARVTLRISTPGAHEVDGPGTIVGEAGEPPWESTAPTVIWLLRL